MKKFIKNALNFFKRESDSKPNVEDKALEYIHTNRRQLSQIAEESTVVVTPQIPKPVETTVIRVADQKPVYDDSDFFVPKFVQPEKVEHVEQKEVCNCMPNFVIYNESK